MAIVLAAGRGERFGGPKVLVSWGVGSESEPWGLAHARARGADCEFCVLVSRAPLLEALGAFALPERTRFVVSDEPDHHGPAGSLRAAVLALRPQPSDEWLVSPVDLPPAAPETVAALVAALRAAPSAVAARPVHEGRGGHPVLIRGGFLLEAFGPDGPAVPPPLRERFAAAREADPGAVIDVPVADPAIALDFDRPEDLVRHRVNAGRFDPRT